MRKVILSFGMTLDGYIARPDGAVDFLPMNRDARQVMAGFFATIDTIIMGRKTLDGAIKMMGGSYRSPVQMPTYVFSRSRPARKYDGYEIVRQSPATLVRRLRSQAGKHIFHMGGGELARTFLLADLVDELYLGIVPILLGSGIPGFAAGFPQRDFRLVECKTYSKGMITVRYRRQRR